MHPEMVCTEIMDQHYYSSSTTMKQRDRDVQESELKLHLVVQCVVAHSFHVAVVVLV